MRGRTDGVSWKDKESMRRVSLLGRYPAYDAFLCCMAGCRFSMEASAGPMGMGRGSSTKMAIMYLLLMTLVFDLLGDILKVYGAVFCKVGVDICEAVGGFLGVG